MKTEMMKLSALKPYAGNAKKHDEKQIKNVMQSIKDFGIIQPLVIDKDNVLIIGHCRLIACKRLKLKEAPVVRLEDLTEEQANKLRLLDNKLNESEWDFDLLTEQVPELDFSEYDIDWQLPEILEEEAEVVEDDVPEQVETRCKLGDVWQLGNHRLICGDSTDVNVIDRLMDGAKADMVFTDPPYGIGIDGQKESKCANPKHNRKAHEFRGWDNARPDKSVFDYILSLNIPSVIFGGNYFADMLPATRGWIYWSKGQDGLTMSDGELAWTNVDKPLRCVTVNRANLGKTVHPTQKPLKVVEFCLDYAGDGEVVLDLFGGSGSTLIACEQLNRKCYMCELDPHYCDVIIQRWENLTKEKAVLLNGE
jgi:DNA modification methylase